MQLFAHNFSADQKVLDIGCGKKPYSHLFSCKYIGVDPFPETRADIAAEAWDIPVESEIFDGAILNQSLEHIAKVEGTISEVFRVLKPGGTAIITVPQSMKNHSAARPLSEAPVNNLSQIGEPCWRVDYYRFTRYGLLYLFRDFEIMSLKETTGYFGSLCQFVIYFFASFHQDWLFRPLYAALNATGWALDVSFRSIAGLHPTAGRFVSLIYDSLTINLILIVRKP